MLRRNLIHCWPRPAAPYRRRGTPPSVALAETSLPPESGVVFGLARARWPRARADRAAGGRLVAPSSHFPLIMLEDDKDRSAPLIALRSPCSASSVRRGISIIVSRAQGSVIQAGNSARVLSGCSTTKWMLPPWCNRRTTTTRSPARGCSGYWIRTSKGCSWAVCRRLEGQHQRVRATDRQPFEGDQLLAIGGSREVDLILGHRQQDLTRVAQLAKAGEDQTDAFLDPSIGIKTKADLAMPDVADRHADPQLATPRLGARGVEHPGTQHAELELADAALRDGDILPKNSLLTF